MQHLKISTNVGMSYTCGERLEMFLDKCKKQSCKEEIAVETDLKSNFGVGSERTGKCIYQQDRRSQEDRMMNNTINQISIANLYRSLPWTNAECIPFNSTYDTLQSFPYVIRWKKSQ